MESNITIVSLYAKINGRSSFRDYSDEADVFLDARDKSDMERNALVSGNDVLPVPKLRLTIPYQSYSASWSTTKGSSSSQPTASRHSTSPSNPVSISPSDIRTYRSKTAKRSSETSKISSRRKIAGN